MDTKHANANRKSQALVNYILEVETAAGSYFIRSHGQLYMFMGLTRRILRLPFNRPGDEIAAYLHGMYGVSLAIPLGRAVYSHLHDHALNNAASTELRGTFASTTHSYRCNSISELNSRSVGMTVTSIS